MPNMTLPDELLGSGPEAFKEYIGNLDPQHQNPIQFQARNINLPVYLVEVGRPRFNHMNGRILPFVLQYCGESGYEPNHFETIDASNVEHQRILHNFLVSNPDRNDAYATFSDGVIPAYTDALVCTPDGRIINGNQRLSVFRELYNDDQREFGHLSHIWIAILPSGGAEDDYRIIEAKFQEDELGSKQFDWIQAGLTRRRDIENGISVESIAQRGGITEDEVLLSIGKIHIVDLYLEFTESNGAYSTFRQGNHTQSIIELQKGMATLGALQGTDNARLINELATNSFKLMQDPDSSAGSGIGVYGHIRIIIELLTEEARNVPPRAAHAENTRLSRRRTRRDGGVQDEIEDDGGIGPILDLSQNEDTSGSEHAQALRDERTVRQGQRNARNQEEYARSQLKSMATVLQNIVENWANFNQAEVPERVNLVEELIAQIQGLVGEDG